MLITTARSSSAERRLCSASWQLQSAVDKYAEALELYDQWQAQGVKTRAELDALLAEMSITAQLAELRRQIEMRTIGLGWRQFETKWSFFKEEKLHTLAQLRSMLLDDILPHEIAMRRSKKLPKEAAPPQLRARELKRLGTVGADLLRIEQKKQKSLFNIDSLMAKAEARRAAREAAGISDSVEARQPLKPPAFDASLVGKHIEVLWPYKLDGKTTKIWAEGTVRKVADGLTDKRSSRAKKILPRGAILWGWDADPERGEKEGVRGMAVPTPEEMEHACTVRMAIRP